MTEQSDEQVVWKVCRREEDKLFSCFAWGKSRLEYKDEWVEAPEGTKLFAFKDVDSAMDFATKYVFSQMIDIRALVPLKAVAQGVCPAPLSVLRNQLTESSSLIKQYWSDHWIFLGDELRPTPPGTVLCQKVKLERISDV